MKKLFKILSSFRPKISKKYLDWAEKRPKAKKGFIRDLQVIRETQRRRAKEVFEKTRAPQGISMNFKSLRLVEMFHAENFEELYKGLISLFPELENSYNQKDFAKKFDNLSTNTNSLGSFHAGDIIAGKKTQQFPWRKPIKTLNNLPEGVSSIAVWVEKILPSVMLVSFDIYFKEDVANNLNSFHEQEFLADVMFKRILPTKRLTRSYTMNDSYDVMTNEMIRWLEQIRVKVERCVKPYLCGYFMNNADGSKACLPSVELFVLKGQKKEEVDLTNFLEESSVWLESWGFISVRDEVYSNNETLFYFPSRSRSVLNRTTWRVVVLEESYLENNNKNRTLKGEVLENEILNDYKYMQDELKTSIVLSEYLDEAGRKIKPLRTVAFNRMENKFFKNSKFTSHIKFNNNLQRELMMLKRMELEFEDNNKVISMRAESLREYTLLCSSKNRGSLYEVLQSMVRFKIDHLKKYHAFISESFSQYLEILNMEGTFRLQRRLLLLTVVMTVATLIMIYSNISGWFVGLLKSFSIL